MARIRLVSSRDGGSPVSLIVEDKVIATWPALDDSDASGLHNNLGLVTNMLREAYEKGRADKEEQIRLVLQSILSV